MDISVGDSVRDSVTDISLIGNSPNSRYCQEILKSLNP